MGGLGTESAPSGTLRSRLRLGLERLSLAAGLLAAVGSCAGGRSAQHPTSAGLGRECAALGALLDLQLAMRGGTTEAADGAKGLGRMDEEWGHLVIADEALRSAADSSSADLHKAVKAERADLALRRERAARLIADLAKSHRELSDMMDEAALCRDIDQRDPGKTPEEVLAGKRDPANDNARTALERSNKKVLRSKDCTDQTKLWSALRRVNLMSHQSVTPAAGHLQELTLAGARADLRDRLANSLGPHGARLEQLRTVIGEFLSIPPAKPRPSRVAIDKEVHAMRLRCLTTLEISDRVTTAGSEPRHATVAVRPKWPESVTDVTGAITVFGSGFVVQWTSSQGERETRIITNNHVMAGAREAEILRSDQLEDADDDQPLRATLIRFDAYDDVAILRIVDEDAAQLEEQGMGFRHEGPEEQEAVVAAGYPGMGAKPSYQVSEGVVSNARYGGLKEDIVGVSGYVQHTAAIDPGNSGGPLLDDGGRVLGMNTIKVVGRENVGLAIPSARIGLALLRADEPPKYHPHQAAAACNLFVAALADAKPGYGDLQRFGFALYESLEDEAGKTEATGYRDELAGAPGSAYDVVRARIYSALRVDLDDSGGVPSFSVCSDVDSDGKGHRFRATFATKKATHPVVIAPEGGLLRVVELSPAN